MYTPFSKHRVVAAAAIGARRRHSGLVGRVDAQRVDEAVPVIVAQVHDIGVGDLAVRIGHADIAFGMQPFGLLIVDDLVGLDAGAVVKHLHVADRRHPRIVVVVIDLDRLDQHLSVVGDARRSRPVRHRIVGKALCRGRGRQGNAEHAGQQQPGHEGEDSSANCGQAEAMTAHGSAPPGCRRPSLEGGDSGHYPSSWYSKAKKPVRPPTHTGSHAAAIGCINSALLKSSVTFDKT